VPRLLDEDGIGRLKMARFENPSRRHGEDVGPLPCGHRRTARRKASAPLRSLVSGSSVVPRQDLRFGIAPSVHRPPQSTGRSLDHAADKYAKSR
jgi:hypothetical protein